MREFALLLPPGISRPGSDPCLQCKSCCRDCCQASRAGAVQVPRHALQVTLQTLLYTQDQQELWAAQQLLRTYCSANQPGCTKLLGTVQVADTRPGPGGPGARTFGSMLLAALLASGGHSLQVGGTRCEWPPRCVPPLSTVTLQPANFRPGPGGPAWPHTWTPCSWHRDMSEQDSAVAAHLCCCTMTIRPGCCVVGCLAQLVAPSMRALCLGGSTREQKRSAELLGTCVTRLQKVQQWAAMLPGSGISWLQRRLHAGITHA